MKLTRTLLNLVAIAAIVLQANAVFSQSISYNSLTCASEDQTVQYQSNRPNDSSCFFPIDQWQIDGQKFIEPQAYCSKLSKDVIAGGYGTYFVTSKFDLESYQIINDSEFSKSSNMQYQIWVDVTKDKNKKPVYSGWLFCRLDIH